MCLLHDNTAHLQYLPFPPSQPHCWSNYLLIISITHYLLLCRHAHPCPVKHLFCPEIWSVCYSTNFLAALVKTNLKTTLIWKAPDVNRLLWCREPYIFFPPLLTIFYSNLHTKSLNPSESQHEFHLCAEHSFKNRTKYNVGLSRAGSSAGYACLSPTEDTATPYFLLS